MDRLRNTLSLGQLIIAVLLIGSFDFVAFLAIQAVNTDQPKDGATIGLLTGIVMALTTTLGAMVGSVFRSSTADARNAESLASLAATAAASPMGGGPQPVTVENNPAHPVPTRET